MRLCGSPFATPDWLAGYLHLHRTERNETTAFFLSSPERAQRASEQARERERRLHAWFRPTLRILRNHPPARPLSGLAGWLAGCLRPYGRAHSTSRFNADVLVGRPPARPTDRAYLSAEVLSRFKKGERKKNTVRSKQPGRQGACEDELAAWLAWQDIGSREQERTRSGRCHVWVPMSLSRIVLWVLCSQIVVNTVLDRHVQYVQIYRISLIK